jgi:hypothetical protein
MAAKKKPAYQDPSKKNRATTKDKPKSSSPSAAQIAALKGPTSTRKPTEAITAPGQKATGLGKSKVQGNRFSSTAKGTGSETKAGTLVKKTAETIAKGTVSLSGAGTVAKGIMKPTKGNIAAAALAVTPVPIGKIGTNAVKKSYALGKTVVHGSPVTGLKNIAPKTGSATRPTENVNFSWSASSKFFDTLTTNARNYARGGSVYVGKVPRGSVVKTNNKKIIVATAPIKVKKEISATAPNLKNQIEKAIPGSKTGSKIRDIKKSVNPKKKK